MKSVGVTLRFDGRAARAEYCIPRIPPSQRGPL